MTERSSSSKARKQQKHAIIDMVFAQFPYMLVHKCKDPALYLKKMPAPGLVLEPEDVIYPNGDAAKTYEPPHCHACGETLTHADFDPRNAVTRSTKH